MFPPLLDAAGGLPRVAHRATTGLPGRVPSAEKSRLNFVGRRVKSIPGGERSPSGPGSLG